MFNKISNFFRGGFSGDPTFETYYGQIMRGRQDGVPSAQEARRDFENIRRVLDKATIY